VVTVVIHNHLIFGNTLLMKK